MHFIKKVIINGFWNQYRVETDFHRDVNIFIGKNGTGKTTFIQFIQAVLKVDIRLLSNLEFSTVKIILKDDKKTKTITVEKKLNTNLPYDLAIYRISTKKHTIPLFSSQEEFRRYSHISSKRLEYDNLRNLLSSMVNLSALSVHRISEEVSSEEELYRRPRGNVSPVDLRLQDLMRQLTTYQLTLEKKSAKISEDYQKGVLQSILYHMQFDRFDEKGILDSDLSKLKIDLTNAYEKLGLLDKKLTNKIEQHFDALNTSITGFKKSYEAKQSLLVNDVMPLPLLKRTQYIIDLSLKSEVERNKIFEHLNRFINILKEFITDKTIQFSADSPIQFIKNKDKMNFTELSSGEKQLLILLTETLLQENRYFIFLADEPELSLHIEWQAKIINSIRVLNPNSQIIVATHSPEIAAGLTENIIDMEDIVNA